MDEHFVIDAKKTDLKVSLFCLLESCSINLIDT